MYWWMQLSGKRYKISNKHLILDCDEYSTKFELKYFMCD